MIQALGAPPSSSAEASGTTGPPAPASPGPDPETGVKPGHVAAMVRRHSRGAEQRRKGSPPKPSAPEAAGGGHAPAGEEKGGDRRVALSPTTPAEDEPHPEGGSADYGEAPPTVAPADTTETAPVPMDVDESAQAATAPKQEPGDGGSSAAATTVTHTATPVKEQGAPGEPSPQGERPQLAPPVEPLQAKAMPVQRRLVLGPRDPAPPVMPLSAKAPPTASAATQPLLQVSPCGSRDIRLNPEFDPWSLLRPLSPRDTGKGKAIGVGKGKGGGKAKPDFTQAPSQY